MYQLEFVPLSRSSIGFEVLRTVLRPEYISGTVPLVRMRTPWPEGWSCGSCLRGSRWSWDGAGMSTCVYVKPCQRGRKFEEGGV